MNENVIGDMRTITNILKKIQNNDEDCPVAITGGEGVGKSTLAILLALHWSGFSLQNNLVYWSKEIGEKIKDLPKGSVLIPDEGMEAFYKRNWMTQERKNFNIMFSMCRQRNLTIFFCIPNFWDLDAYFRNWRIKMWIHVPERGKALVLTPVRNPYSQDPWCQKKNETIVNEAWAAGDRLRDGIVNGIMKTPNFKYYFEFPDLPPGVKDEYIRKKEENWKRLQEVLDEKTQMEMSEAWLGNIASTLNSGLHLCEHCGKPEQLSLQTIAGMCGNFERETVGPSQNTLSNYIRLSTGSTATEKRLNLNVLKRLGYKKGGVV